METPAASPVTGTPSAAPRHVAVIMDGNGRWAKARGLPRSAGHQAGAEAVRRTIRAAISEGVEYLTLFGFSAENWTRPQDEVTDLMGLLRLYLRRELDELAREGVQLRIIGDRRRFSPDIVKLFSEAEAKTAGNDRLVLTVALSYGGRQDILQATRRLAEDVALGRIRADEIDELSFSRALQTGDAPEPDLLIRTSGEQRISNFLLWQLAYTEFVFTECLWPDFDERAFSEAVAVFASRERRFGGREAASA